MEGILSTGEAISFSGGCRYIIGARKLISSPCMAKTVIFVLDKRYLTVMLRHRLQADQAVVVIRKHKLIITSNTCSQSTAPGNHPNCS